MRGIGVRARAAFVLLSSALIACNTPLEKTVASVPNAAVPPGPGPVGSGAVAGPTPSASASDAYMGRQKAEPMSYLGAEWLERPEREKEEQPEHMLDILKLAPGMTVADVGAGSGYYTERLSRRVGPKGKVLATDLQPEMLALVKKKIADKHLANVETILTTETDSKLPKRSVDLVLMVDVYHELPDPKATLAQVSAALRPGGRLALVEFKAEDPNVPIKTEHKMTLPQIEKELEAANFAIATVDESLPWQRVVLAKPK